VLKGIQQGMNLPIEAVLPSFASLRDMGNTSSSTTWYSIAYLETQKMVTRGQTIMQVCLRCCVCSTIEGGAGNGGRRGVGRAVDQQGGLQSGPGAAEASAETACSDIAMPHNI
jgi:hypothetical protein